MILDDFTQVTDGLPPDTPVVFCNATRQPLDPDEYCDGVAVFPSKIWSYPEGWVPCVTVELGDVP